MAHAQLSAELQRERGILARHQEPEQEPGIQGGADTGGKDPFLPTPQGQGPGTHGSQLRA